MSLLRILAIMFAMAIMGVTLTRLTTTPRAEVWRTDRSDGWYEVLNLRSNAFYLWRDDSLLAPIARRVPQLLPPIQRSDLDLVSPDSTKRRGMFLFHALLALAAGGLLSAFATRERAFGFIAGVASTALLLSLSYREQYLVGAFAWTLALAACLSISLGPRSTAAPRAPTLSGWRSIALILVFALLGFRSAANSIHLGILVVLAASWLAHLAAHAPLTRKSLILTFVLLIPSLLTTLTSPTPFSPSYPEGAHVVADDEIPGMVRPLLGPTFIIPVIDQGALRSTFETAAFITFGLSLLTLGLTLLTRSGADRVRMHGWFGAAFAGIATLEVTLLPELTQALPLSTLQRIIPGLFYVPIVPFALAVSVLASCILIAQLERRAALALVPLLALGLLFRGSSEKNLPSDVMRPFHDFAHLISRSGVSQETIERTRSALLSPSFAVLRERGLWLVERGEEIQRARVFRPPFEGLFVTSSHQTDPGAFAGMFDRKPDTRWSPGGGKQTGKEWLCVQWQGPALEFAGVELDPSSFFTDFPRGIAVAAGATCPPGGNPITELPPGFTQVFHSARWEGQIAFTSDGYPYYLTQDNVRSHFEKPVVGNAVLIKQIGNHPAWDWSVSEFRLLRERSITR